MNIKLAALLVFSLFCSMPYAADIYRWVDEMGRTQFADSVPEQYKNSATKVDSRTLEPTAVERREAEARAAREKAQAAARKGETTPPRFNDSKSASSRKPAVNSASNDCATQERLYRESQECFAPYRQAKGGIKAEAFERCVEVKDPSAQCGARAPY